MEVDVREAGKQSGNPYFPKINVPTKISNILSHPIGPGFIGIPMHAAFRQAPSEGNDRMRECINYLKQLKESNISLWIGPEGGFSNDEMSALLAHGVKPLIVGSHTLRVETAVAACLGAINFMRLSPD